MNVPTNIQIINGSDGKSAVVVVPYEEYRKGLGEDTVPHAVVVAMVENDWTPVRAWREHLGMTQAEVAAHLGISQSPYAQQETGAKLRKASRQKIAVALGISADLLDV